MTEILGNISLLQIIEYLVVGVIVIFTILEKSGSKYNPWSAILRGIGRTLNGEVFKKFDTMEADFEDLKGRMEKLQSDFEEDKAVSARIRIARFADELRLKVQHSKDHFDQTMLDITYYENYCATHPAFRNEITVSSIILIKKVYQELLEENGFLV